VGDAVELVGERTAETAQIFAAEESAPNSAVAGQ
jgi:hypothetical protein